MFPADRRSIRSLVSLPSSTIVMLCWKSCSFLDSYVDHSLSESITRVSILLVYSICPRATLLKRSHYLHSDVKFMIRVFEQPRRNQWLSKFESRSMSICLLAFRLVPGHVDIIVLLRSDQKAQSNQSTRIIHARKTVASCCHMDKTMKRFDTEIVHSVLELYCVHLHGVGDCTNRTCRIRGIRINGQ
jgi:hypothetical protein